MGSGSVLYCKCFTALTVHVAIHILGLTEFMPPSARMASPRRVAFYQAVSRNIEPFQCLRVCRARRALTVEEWFQDGPGVAVSRGW